MDAVLLALAFVGFWVVGLVVVLRSLETPGRVLMVGGLALIGYGAKVGFLDETHAQIGLLVMLIGVAMGSCALAYFGRKDKRQQ